MPSTVSYPGVYIEEIPSGVHPITGVATSIAAFLGLARRGPVNAPQTINGFADFERIFGGLWEKSALGFAVRDFFLNGGAQGICVRLHHYSDAAHPENDAAKVTVTVGGGDLVLNALYPGLWGRGLRASVQMVNNPVISAAVAQRLGISLADLGPIFNLTVTDAGSGTVESYSSVSLAEKAGVQRLDEVLARQSKLVSWTYKTGLTPKDADDAAAAKQKAKAQDITDKTKDLAAKNKTLASGQSDLDTKLAAQQIATAYNTQVQADATASASDKTKAQNAKDAADAAVTAAQTALTVAQTAQTAAAKALADAQKEVQDVIDAMGGSDSGELTKNDDFEPVGAQANKKGVYALEKVDLFNLLLIPPYKTVNGVPNTDVEPDLTADAAAYCEQRRAMLIVDPPSGWRDVDTAATDARTVGVGTASKNAALYFPRLKQPNPLKSGQVEIFAPCGVVAGVFARTDTTRGVWKAPVGLDATLNGVPDLTVNMTDAENGQLNQIGVNCLRPMPAVGRVVWGARTLQGADRLASEWKYIPIRRLALYIEESLYRGTQWVVFEPNDEPLWAQVRLNVGAFMNRLFRQGAFQGQTPQQAYFVKCDKETNPPDVVNLGIVNIVVGFAPLKPAEFVVIQIQQMSSASAT
jgi:phage tail sheath protein FI